LEDAVAAIKGTIRADVEDLVPAAEILPGSGAGFEKLTGKRKEPKSFFVRIKPVEALQRQCPIHSDPTGALELLHNPLRKRIFFSILFENRGFNLKIHLSVHSSGITSSSCNA